MKKGNFETFLVRDAVYTFGFVYDDKYREDGKRPLSFKLSKQDLRDLHSILSELLDTHTVKEEKDSCPYGTQTCRYNGNLCALCRHDDFDGIYLYNNGKKYVSCGIDDRPKEQPTTPEESICIECKKRPAIVGVLCDFCRSLPPEECQPTTPECSHEMPTWASSCNCSCRTAQVSNSYEVPTPTTTPEKCPGKYCVYSSVPTCPFDGSIHVATPEKGCCDCFGKEPIALGVVLGGGEFKCQCKCHKEKLPSERIFEIREKGGKEVLPSNGEEYYVMPIAKAIMMYLDEQHKKK